MLSWWIFWLQWGSLGDHHWAISPLIFFTLLLLPSSLKEISSWLFLFSIFHLFLIFLASHFTFPLLCFHHLLVTLQNLLEIIANNPQNSTNSSCRPKPSSSRLRSLSCSRWLSTLSTPTRRSSCESSSPTPPMPLIRSAMSPSPTPPSSTRARISVSTSSPTRRARPSPSVIPVSVWPRLYVLSSRLENFSKN